MEDQALTWQALQWADGTRYEGLTKGGKLHSHGVLTFPNKDRYEGQFEAGEMHGAGVYVWSNGTIYRGDWAHGLMHGCGTTLSRQQPGGPLAAAEGKYFGNSFVGDVMPCSQTDGYEAAVEADVAAYQARSFAQWRQPQRLVPSETRARQGVRQQQQQQQQPKTAVESGQPLDQQQQQKLQGVVQHLASQPLQGRQTQRSTPKQAA